MKNVIFILTALCMFGCSSAVKRTKYSDKTMRVLIDPSSIDSSNHVAIQQALVETGKFFVVDRSKAFAAIVHEQNRQHTSMSDRFEDREKYAQWGKMYGAGGVITAHVQCANNGTGNIVTTAFHLATLATMWSEYRCSQFLEVIDTATTEVVASIKYDIKADTTKNLDWSDAVEALVDSYPEIFEDVKNHRVLETYKAVSAEEAQRHREAASTGGQ